MRNLKPRGRPGFTHPGYHHPDHTPLEALRRLGRRVSRCFCRSSCSESESNPRSTRSFQPYLAEVEEWERYNASFVVHSVRCMVGVKHEDIAYADKDRHGPPQPVISDPSHWEENRSWSESSVAVSLVSMPIILSEPPEIPGLFFEGFTLRSLLREIPPEVSGNWLSFLHSQSNRTSQVIEGIGSQRSSIINLGGLLHGLSMSGSPGLQSNEVLSATESPPHELFLRAIPPPRISAVTLDFYSDSDLGEEEPPPDLDWFLRCLNGGSYPHPG
jgi:hypothetical protein